MCGGVQAIQDEAQRMQGHPRLSFSCGQHSLAMLYIVDALCSMAKPHQRSLQDKARASLRKTFGQALPELVRLLATPCNCEKVRPQSECFAHASPDVGDSLQTWHSLSFAGMTWSCMFAEPTSALVNPLVRVVPHTLTACR
jgi:hypothetical protein